MPTVPHRQHRTGGVGRRSVRPLPATLDPARRRRSSSGGRARQQQLVQPPVAVGGWNATPSVACPGFTAPLTLRGRPLSGLLHDSRTARGRNRAAVSLSSASPADAPQPRSQATLMLGAPKRISYVLDRQARQILTGAEYIVCMYSMYQQTGRRWRGGGRRGGPGVCPEEGGGGSSKLPIGIAAVRAAGACRCASTGQGPLSPGTAAPAEEAWNENESRAAPRSSRPPWRRLRHIAPRAGDHQARRGRPLWGNAAAAADRKSVV